MAKRRRRKQASSQDGSADISAQAGEVYAPQAVANIREWAAEAAAANGVALYDVEMVVHGRWTIRVYIDRPGPLNPEESVKAGECQKVSRYLEAYLDAASDLPDNYVLEVSSPGIERLLKTPEHLEMVVGHRVQLVVRTQVEGKNKFSGELMAYQDGVLSVLLDEGPNEPVDIQWADVKEARLKYDFDF
ncbi:ribosome maturation factor RimP [Bradymonas sediminis]|uniref:ribosome maturation factor RimP n=1 Tax=Bradymonas sediminis TaxID=1548548 RepID=UPI0013A6AE33|nr:ribosome maturation factor RimP [Bradymonas sediminis]